MCTEGTFCDRSSQYLTCITGFLWMFVSLWYQQAHLFLSVHVFYESTQQHSRIRQQEIIICSWMLVRPVRWWKSKLNWKANKWAVYWRKMSSFSCVGDLHSHSCGDLCERLCGLQQHRSRDNNTGWTDEEGSVAGGHWSPSWIIQTSLYTTCWADRIQSDVTRLDIVPVTGKRRYSMTPFWVVTGGRLLSLREIWSNRRGVTEKDPVIVLLGCCRHLSFALKTPTSPQVVRSCKRVGSVKMKSKKVFFSSSVIFFKSCSYL